MAQTKPQKYWFRTKRYGFGWSVPITWQGWVVFLTFLGIFFGALAVFILPYMNKSVPTRNIILYAVIATIDISVLNWVAVRRGEPAHWRWGKK
jgi:hypothetical protein